MSQGCREILPKARRLASMDAATVLAQRLDVPDTAAECRELKACIQILRQGIVSQAKQSCIFCGRLAGIGQSGYAVFPEGLLLKFLSKSYWHMLQLSFMEAKIFNVCGRKLTQLMDSPLPMVQRQASVSAAWVGSAMRCKVSLTVSMSGEAPHQQSGLVKR